MSNKDKNFEERELVPAEKGYCPNCWGHQEYQDKIYNAAESNNINLINVEQKLGWIQSYAAKYLLGIKLEKTDGIDTCPACQI